MGLFSPRRGREQTNKGSRQKIKNFINAIPSCLTSMIETKESLSLLKKRIGIRFSIFLLLITLPIDPLMFSSPGREQEKMSKSANDNGEFVSMEEGPITKNKNNGKGTHKILHQTNLISCASASSTLCFWFCISVTKAHDVRVYGRRGTTLRREFPYCQYKQAGGMRAKTRIRSIHTQLNVCTYGWQIAVSAIALAYLGLTACFRLSPWSCRGTGSRRRSRRRSTHDTTTAWRQQRLAPVDC